MSSTIEDKLPVIKMLCQEHGVEAFYLFGSAAKGGMKETSDYDFMVRFSSDVQLLDYADNSFSLLTNLKNYLNERLILFLKNRLRTLFFYKR